jgi:hypothetical protein
LVYTDGKSSGGSGQEGANKVTFKDTKLVDAFNALGKTAERVADTMTECKIQNLDREEFVS